MLALTQYRFATVSELFRYKHEGFELPEFPGYTPDQWGIKAHNRPWIEEAGAFTEAQRIIEVGGGYSSLPAYLARKCGTETWVGDDFGESSGQADSWTRWGNPRDLPSIWSDVRYVFKPLGEFLPEYPDDYFDRVFSVSTLEHIPWEKIDAVLGDMHRILAPGGRELHSVDIGSTGYRRLLVDSMLERLSMGLGINAFVHGRVTPTWRWLQAFSRSGVDISRVTAKSFPYLDNLLDKETLLESYDVVFRFYPPNDSSKAYVPSASLLIVIEDVAQPI